LRVKCRFLIEWNPEVRWIAGKPVSEKTSRRDARDKLRGRTRYTIDRYLPGMLHAEVLRASVPSGRIIRLDVSEQRACPACARS